MNDTLDWRTFITFFKSSRLSNKRLHISRMGKLLYDEAWNSTNAKWISRETTGPIAYVALSFV